ncbi:MAG: T9SS type A sorting domain-containing protein [bacterium]|nr:T9SS type A sorting domain-containing protein [bacterium]
MKHFAYVTIFVVMFATICFAQLNARDGYMEVNGAVQAAYPGSELRVIVSTDSSIGANGTSHWLFHYYHPTTSQWISAMVIPQMGPYVRVEQSPGSTFTQTIPPTFFNSPNAMTVAESNGGSTYRSTHPGCFVRMMGGNFTLTPPMPTLVWMIMYYDSYQASSPSLWVIVDIITGELVIASDTPEASVAEIPTSVTLHQNYPNPFNPSTEITYGLHKAGNVRLTVFNELGKEVTTLVNGYQAANNYHVSFNAAGLPSGTYYYTLRTNGFITTKQMVLTK